MIEDADVRDISQACGAFAGAHQEQRHAGQERQAAARGHSASSNHLSLWLPTWLPHVDIKVVHLFG